MRTKVSRLIMVMKMVLAESCGHIILSHLLQRLKTRKYLLQVQVNIPHFNPFPLPSAQRGGRELLVVIDSLKTTLGLSPQ